MKLSRWQHTHKRSSLVDSSHCHLSWCSCFWQKRMSNRSQVTIHYTTNLATFTHCQSNQWTRAMRIARITVNYINQMHKSNCFTFAINTHSDLDDICSATKSTISVHSMQV